MSLENRERIQGPLQGEADRTSWPWGPTIALLCGVVAWLGMLTIFFGATWLPSAFYRGSSHGEGYNTGTWSILLLALSRELWFASLIGGCLTLTRAMSTNDHRRRYAIAWVAIAVGFLPWMRIGTRMFFGGSGVLSSLVGLTLLCYVVRPSLRQFLGAFLGGVVVAGTVAAAIILIGPDVTGIEWELFDDWHVLAIRWLANLALVATAMALVVLQSTLCFGWRGLATVVMVGAIIRGVPTEQKFQLPSLFRTPSLWDLRASASVAGAIGLSWLVMWLVARPKRMVEPSSLARHRLGMTAIVFLLCYSNWLGIRALWMKLQTLGGAHLPVGAFLLFVVVYLVTRATVRRAIGALAGGAVVAAVLGLVLATCDSDSRWGYLCAMLTQMWEPPWIETMQVRSSAPGLAGSLPSLMVRTALLWAPIALCSWRAVRAFGALGLVVAAVVAAAAGPPWESLVTLHNYSYSAEFIAVPLAIGIEYAATLLLAYVVMRLIAGSAAGSGLARFPWEGPELDSPTLDVQRRGSGS